MTLLFKVTGFLLIIFTTTAIGFIKSGELNMRYKKLCTIQQGIHNLKERIRLHSGEIDRLIALSFSEYPINYKYLEKDECEIIDDFFANLGMSDTDAEYKRCELYINMINNKADEALKKHRELSRLYKSIGVMSGIFICIFLI